MMIVDEISFISKHDYELLNDVLNKKTESPNGIIFGNLQMVFAGDFCQLKPTQVGAYPLYAYKDCELWRHKVSTFLELHTNHRFLLDRKWGQRLERFCDTGPSLSDVNRINSRVIKIISP